MQYVINLAQPAKRLLRTLLDVDVPIDGEFMAEQERRRAKNLPDEIYDVTAWSLPLMMNVEIDPCRESVSGDFTPAGPDLIHPGSVSAVEDAVAYLVPWGSAPAIRFLAGALREGLAVKSNDEAFTHNGQRYPSGTLILDVADNPDHLSELINNIAARTGAQASQ